jgi:hypothetical protein
MLSQESICFAKMATAEESTVSGEGRGVRSLEDDMFCCINEGFLFLGVTSPQEENKKITFFGECFDNRISKIFPSFSCMRHRLPRSYSQGSIEEENTLFGPTCEVTIFWTWNTEVSLNLLKYIHK